MPKGYYQCPKCRTPFSTKFQGNKHPQIKCYCGGDPTTEGIIMTFRGSGWDGRNNWPHGRPPRVNPHLSLYKEPLPAERIQEIREEIDKDLDGFGDDG